MDNALTLTEQAELEQQETIIARGLNTFVEVGEALLKIRDSKLYRVDYSTFEEYCRVRWQIGQAHAYRLMDAAQTVNNLKVLPGGELPEYEKHARPLAPLEPDDQRLAWQIVQETAPKGQITAAHVQSVVNVLNEVKATGALDPGDGEMLPFSDALKAAVTEETYERMKRQETYIAEKQNGKHKPKENRAGDEYVAQGYDACQTPPYALDPLLSFIEPNWTIWEPACGEGYLVEALYDSGFDPVLQSDILTHQNFFEYEPDEHWDCIITNPPYSIKYKWLERCYALGKPFALLLPVETLGAKTAQVLFRQYGIKVVFLDQRVNFKMPNAGWEGSSAQFPTAWFCWQLPLDAQMIFAEIERNE